MQRAAARVTSLLALRRLATSASRPALSAAVAPLRRAAVAVNATARWPLQPTTAAAAAALCARRGYAGGARKAKAVSDDEDDDDEEFEAMGTDEEFDGDFDDEDLEDTDDDEDDEDEPVKKRGRR